MIKNVLFDFGGVFVRLNREEAVRRLEELGIHDAGHMLDPYLQSGLFLELESGKYTEDEFTDTLNHLYGLKLDKDQIQYALLGFLAEVQQEKFRYIRHEWLTDIRLLLVSNINPFVWGYAKSGQMIDGGYSIEDFFEKIYASYEVGICKPDREIFTLIIEDSGIKPEETLFIDDGSANTQVARELGFVTYCPDNGEDWRPLIDKMLKR